MKLITNTFDLICLILGILGIVLIIVEEILERLGITEPWCIEIGGNKNESDDI